MPSRSQLTKQSLRTRKRSIGYYFGLTQTGEGDTWPDAGTRQQVVQKTLHNVQPETLGRSGLCCLQRTASVSAAQKRLEENIQGSICLTLQQRRRTGAAAYARLRITTSTQYTLQFTAQKLSIRLKSTFCVIMSLIVLQSIFFPFFCVVLFYLFIFSPFFSLSVDQIPKTVSHIVAVSVHVLFAVLKNESEPTVHQRLTGQTKRCELNQEQSGRAR